MDGEGSHEGYPYLGGGQSNQPHNYMSYRENDQTREYTPFPYSARSSRGHSIGQSRDQTPMEDYQNIIYSASRSRSASHFGDQPGSGYESDTPQSLHAMIAQLTNAVKNLSDAQTRFEEELSSIREATQSLTACFNTNEGAIEELREKLEGQQKKTSSKTSSNDHTIVKVRISNESGSKPRLTDDNSSPSSSRFSVNCVE